jgi:transcription termination/antitermination protein NusA
MSAPLAPTRAAQQDVRAQYLSVALMPDESAADMFVRTLGANRHVAEVLVAEGFTTLEEVAYVPENELMNVEGLSTALLSALRQRARAYLLSDALGNEGKW